MSNSELEYRMDRVEHTLFGNAQLNLVREMHDLISKQEGRKEAREEHAHAADRKWNLCLGLLTVVLAAVEIYVHWHK